jgi:hypothetical protein
MELGTIELEKDIVRDLVKNFFINHESWLMPNIILNNKFEVNEYGSLFAEDYNFSKVNGNVRISVNETATTLCIEAFLNKKVEYDNDYRIICRLNDMLTGIAIVICVDDDENIRITRRIDISTLLYVSSHKDSYSLYAMEEKAFQVMVFETIGSGSIFKEIINILLECEEVDDACERLFEYLY